MKALEYLRENEWTMGNGQCHECCGKKPRVGWWTDTVGHNINCNKAKAIEALGGKVVWEHFNHSKIRREYVRAFRKMFDLDKRPTRSPTTVDQKAMNQSEATEQPAGVAGGSLHGVVRTPGYREPNISVDRMSKSIACFDGFKCVRDFQKYTSEADALKDAHEWFKTRTIHVPQVVFPMIRKMRVS